MMRGTLTAMAVIAASVAGLSAAQAASVSLSNGLSAAEIAYGTTNIGAYSSANTRSGVYYLFRDGGGDKIQDAVQQTLFYRVGGAGAATEINTGTTASLLSSTATKATIKYADLAGQFNIYVTYALKGSGSSGFLSTLDRTVLVENTSGSALNMSLFSYNDYTLTGLSTAAAPAVPGNAYADNNIQPPFTAPDGYEFAKVKSVGSGVEQWDTWGSADSTKISALSNVYNKPADAIEIVSDGSLLGKLTSTGDLSQTAGVVGGQNGNGLALDVEFAAQWNLSIGSGKTATVTEQSTIIPEPASLGLLALGAGLLAYPRRRNAR